MRARPALQRGKSQCRLRARSKGSDSNGDVAHMKYCKHKRRVGRSRVASSFATGALTTRIVSLIANTAAFLALLAVAACSSTGKLFERTPTATEELEGNYRTLAACTLDRLARQP